MGKGNGSKRGQQQRAQQSKQAKQQQTQEVKKTPLELMQESWTEELSWVKATTSALIELTGVDRAQLDNRVFELMGLHKIEQGGDIQQFDELVLDITATDSEGGRTIQELSARAFKLKVGTNQIIDFLERAAVSHGYNTNVPFVVTGAKTVWGDERLPESVTFNFTFHRGSRLLVNQEAYKIWLSNLKANLSSQFEYLEAEAKATVISAIESYNTARELRVFVAETHQANVHARTEWFMTIVKSYDPTFVFDGKTLNEIMTAAMKFRIEDAKNHVPTETAPTEAPTTTEA